MCHKCFGFAPQADADGGSEASKPLSQRKSLRPSLTRSPTVNKGPAAPEKPGAAMVSTSRGNAPCSLITDSVTLLSYQPDTLSHCQQGPGGS